MIHYDSPICYGKVNSACYNILQRFIYTASCIRFLASLQWKFAKSMPLKFSMFFCLSVSLHVTTQEPLNRFSVNLVLHSLSNMFKNVQK
jgi:hypothetical protein